jgi:hypothetical protein
MSNSRYKRGDKILDNDFNQNNIDFNPIQNNNLDEVYVSQHLDY